MNRARVISTGRVSVPNTGEPALQIDTDLPDAANRAFYVEPGAVPPSPGDWVEWGRRKALVGERWVRKIGYSFDPDAPLH